MIVAIAALLLCQLAGEALVRGLALPVPGPVLGAVLISLLYSFLTGAFPGTWLYFLGALFISVVLFIPDGIIGLVDRLRRARRAP